MEFSNRSSFGVSGPSPLFSLLEKKRAARAEVLDLTESNPTKCGFQYNVGARHAAPLHDPVNLIYDPDPRGLLSAREAVCAYYAAQGVTLHPDDVFLTCGTSEAYSFLFHVLCAAGEEVLSPRPGYPLVEHLAAFHEVRVRRFSGPIGAQESGRAKAALFVNPSNPAGRYLSAGEWEEAERFCAERGMAVVSDEVFFDFNWTGTARPGGVSRGDGLHVTLNGVSKMLGLPQMKLAWLALSGPKKDRRAFSERLEPVADAFLSVNTPAQNALPAWLSGRDAFIAQVMGRLRSNFAALRGFFPSAAEPDGGWYAVLPLPPGVSDEETALRLLEEAGVLTHPGYLFDFEEDCLVLSLLTPPEGFLEGVGRLARTAGVLC